MIGKITMNSITANSNNNKNITNSIENGCNQNNGLRNC